MSTGEPGLTSQQRRSISEFDKYWVKIGYFIVLGLCAAYFGGLLSTFLFLCLLVIAVFIVLPVAYAAIIWEDLGKMPSQDPRASASHCLTG